MVSRRAFMGSLITSPLLHGETGDLEWSSVEDTGRLLRRKKTSPVELTRACLNRVEKLNSKLNAFITVTADEALDAAATLHREAQAGRWRGPLHGIPIALKDLYDTTGVRTTAASRQW